MYALNVIVISSLLTWLVLSLIFGTIFGTVLTIGVVYLIFSNPYCYKQVFNVFDGLYYHYCNY